MLLYYVSIIIFRVNVIKITYDKLMYFIVKLAEVGK